MNNDPDTAPADEVAADGGKVVIAGRRVTPWEAATYARRVMAASWEAAEGTWRPCKFCPAPMVVAQMDQTGRNIPIDPGDDPGGNLAIRWERGQTKARTIKVGAELEPGEHPVRSHFVTCRGADQARRPRTGPPARR